MNEPTNGTELNAPQEEVKVAEPNFDLEAGKSTVSDDKPKGVIANMPGLTFWNDGYSVTLGNISSDGSEATSMFTPGLIHADEVMSEKRQWTRHIRVGDDSIIGPRTPRLKSLGGEVTGKTAIELIRRASGTGGELTYELLKTGIRVTVAPPTEEKFINLQYSLSQVASQVGTSSTGLLLNARSGVFSEHLVRLALDHVIDCNLKTGADERTEVLLDVIDAEDYGTLIWGVLASKFPNGHPWSFACSDVDNCGHHRDATIFFSRMLWHDRSMLTESQLNILKSTTANITLEQVETYKSEFDRQNSVVELECGIRIRLKSATMRGYLSTARSWVDEIERMYNRSMSSYNTEASRNAYLDSIIQARRMLKYLHLVDSLEIPGVSDDDYNIIKDEETIRASLIELSGLDSNFSVFEGSVATYLESNAVSVIGYPNQECPKCNYKPDYGDGRFRAIVPVAVDRVLFTLVQQRNMLMQELATK